MKKLLLVIIFLLLPTILLEGILRVRNDVYQKIIMYNADFSEWQQAAPQMNYWPETVIFGTSIAKQDIDPLLLQKQLRRNGVITSAGNAAANAESTSSDYLQLKRILATCIVCPKRLIYQVSDVSLRNFEVKEWKDTTLRKMLRLYYQDPQNDEVLEKAGTLDPYFREYYLDVQAYSAIRTSFTKQRLLSLIMNGFYEKIGLTSKDNYEPNYSDQEIRNGLNGYYSYTTPMDEKTRTASLNHEKDVLTNFHIGNATEYFFLETLKVAKAHKIKVYLVLTPENQLHINTFRKEEKILSDYVKKISKKYDMPLIDDRAFHSRDDSLFYDLKHLDRKGANLYSPYLGKRLAAVWN